MAQSKTNPYKKLEESLDRILEGCVSRQVTSGVVVKVMHDGQQAYFRAHGMADNERAIPMLRDTRFRLASITKAFTSLAVAALISRGKMGFDDPVTNWLPFFAPKLPDGATPVIRIRHLLSHMAGLDYRWAQREDGPYANAGISDGLDVSSMTLEENLVRLAGVPLFFRPESDWRYSLAPDVLGEVVARANGTDFATAMAELVLLPLGITKTAFAISGREKDQVAVPYYLEGSRLTRMEEEQYLTDLEGRHFHFSPRRAFLPRQYPSGGVGLTGTASDLMRIVEVIRTNVAPFADSATLAAMSQNQLPPGKYVFPGVAFGMGWGIVVDPAAADNTPQSPGTLAWGGVYGSKWFADPAKKLSVVTMTTTALNDEIAIAVRNAVYASLAS